MNQPLDWQEMATDNARRITALRVAGIAITDLGDLYLDTFVRWVTADRYDEFRLHHQQVLAERLTDLEAQRARMVLTQGTSVNNRPVNRP